MDATPRNPAKKSSISRLFRLAILASLLLDVGCGPQDAAMFMDVLAPGPTRSASSSLLRPGTGAGPDLPPRPLHPGDLQLVSAGPTRESIGFEPVGESSEQDFASAPRSTSPPADRPLGDGSTGEGASSELSGDVFSGTGM